MLSRFLVLVFIFGVSINAAAAPALLVDSAQHKSYFQQLVEKFESAKASQIRNIQEINGSFLGRCFFITNGASGNSPHAGIFHGQYVDDNNGPMFPPQDFRFNVFHNEDPTKFDNFEPAIEEALLAAFKNFLPETHTYFENNGWKGFFQTTDFELRKYENYLLVLFNANADSATSSGIKKGDHLGSCYFFKKLK